MRKVSFIVSSLFIVLALAFNSTFQKEVEEIPTRPATHICSSPNEVLLQFNCDGPNCDEAKMDMMRNHLYFWLETKGYSPEQFDGQLLKIWYDDFLNYLTLLSPVEVQQYGFLEPKK